LRIYIIFALVSPEFCNIPSGFVKPILICGQADDFDGCKPFWRVGSRITKRHQLAHPIVSTPVTWDEVAMAFKKKSAKYLTFEVDDILKRVKTG
jgi:hypothetical protein